MSIQEYTGAQIDRMDGNEIGAMLDRLGPGVLRSMLIRLSGRDSQIFEYLLRSPSFIDPEGYVCGLRADDENWCILPKGHAESHDAGDFTWDVWEEREDAPRVTEFVSDSRSGGTAPCGKPEEHGFGALGGNPNVPVLCDKPAHHDAELHITPQPLRSLHTLTRSTCHRPQ